VKDPGDDERILIRASSESAPGHDRVRLMRIVLAVCAALLVIGGVWTAAFTAVGSSDQPTLIGPAVVVGSTSSATTTPGVGPTGSPSSSGSGSDDDVTKVSPSGAVTVTDDHGGKQNGKGKDH
jgi:hypothetical protein